MEVRQQLPFLRIIAALSSVTGLDSVVVTRDELEHMLSTNYKAEIEIISSQRKQGVMDTELIDTAAPVHPLGSYVQAKISMALKPNITAEQGTDEFVL